MYNNYMDNLFEGREVASEPVAAQMPTARPTMAQQPMMQGQMPQAIPQPIGQPVEMGQPRPMMQGQPMPQPIPQAMPQPVAQPMEMESNRLMQGPPPGHSHQKPKPLPQPLPMPMPEVGKIYMYTVGRGDNLYGVSRRFNTSVELIRLMNRLEPNTMLYPGQKLLIPVLYAGQRTEEKPQQRQSYDLYF